MNLSPSNLSCSWWKLPKFVQKFLEKLTGFSSWTFHVYKNDDGTWGFDIPWLLTFNEKFINGTELDLDYWYEELSGKQPDLTSKFDLIVSCKEIEDPTTVCEFIGDDEFSLLFEPDTPSIELASYYLDQKSGYTIWLCQYLQFLFQSKPQKLYLKLSILN